MGKIVAAALGICGCYLGSSPLRNVGYKVILCAAIHK